MNNFIKDIKLIIVNKKILGTIVVMMLMVCALLCTHHNIEKKEKKVKFIIGIINEEDNSYADLLIDFFRTNESFTNLASIVEGEKEHIEEEFRAGNINAYMIIPKGFVNALMYLEELNIEVFLKSDNETEAIVLKSLLESYEKYVVAVQYNTSGLYDICKQSGLERKLNHKQNVNVSFSLIKKAMNKEKFFKYNEEEIGAVSLISHYVYVIIYVVIMYMAIYIGVIVKREQYSGLLALYKVSGGNFVTYIISKALCVAIMISFCMCTFLVVSLNTNKGIVLPTSVLIVFLISFIMNICMILSSLLIKNINIYTLLFNTISLMTIVVGGGIIPSVYMPDKMMVLAKYMPFNIFEHVIKGYISF